ncbi:MAG: hypothetical protein JWQ38_662 [Flavipsychrobacter sp.]|nr:hypothetical protein [Flavipsychrobacter sp.]
MSLTKKSALLVLLTVLLLPVMSNAKGKWDSVVNTSPRYNKGVLLLLTDGTVLAKTSGGGSDVYGSGWDRLTPDIHGSYRNGTWTRAASMADTRLYFSSQVLKNGMVYVAGGEYGSGRNRGEIYDPQFDFWSPVKKGLPVITDTLSDANSEILPDGRVLQAVVFNKSGVCKKTYIYDPVADSFTVGPPTLGIANESVWLKLQDNSILFVDVKSTNAERYIPALNKWISDSNVTVPLYDIYGSETGAAMLLPDGRGFFIGSSGYTAYYTPSGDTSAGSWTTGPMIPDTMGAPDAAAAMMVNGKILCSFSHIPTVDSVFHKPMSFYEFDYKTNTFTKLTAPNGEDSSHTPAYFSNMLCLPDGTILYGPQGDDQYYTYTPDSAPLPEGKPTLSTVATVHCDTFMATGMLFNGITEGASYGDDWQMNTNYPIIRLVSTTGDTVMYMQTLNWNSTGVSRGTQADTTLFVFPINVTMPEGSFSVQVVVNGNASDMIPFDVCAKMAVNEVTKVTRMMNIYPNPADKMATVEFEAATSGTYNVKLEDVFGRVVKEMSVHGNAGKNTCNMQLDRVAPGVYTITVRTGADIYNSKLIVK